MPDFTYARAALVLLFYCLFWYFDILLLAILPPGLSAALLLSLLVYYSCLLDDGASKKVSQIIKPFDFQGFSNVFRIYSIAAAPASLSRASARVVKICTHKIQKCAYFFIVFSRLFSRLCEKNNNLNSQSQYI